MDARESLSRLPAVPRDVNRFSSNALFGEPGIYPDGTPMVPAAGRALDEDQARGALVALRCDDATRWFDRPELVTRAPDPGPRAGIAALVGTIAESLVDAFVAGATTASALRLGVPMSPGRVVGPSVAGPSVEPPGVRVVNTRYRAEHPALLAASLCHDLLWTPGAGQYEECLLHALGAMVHVQLLARAPGLADLRTELARRQNSLAITLLNSRHPGSADIALRAPDGSGTIPGGAPAMQTPDFWSIPFVAGEPTPSDAPATLASVLSAVLEPGTQLPDPLRYDPQLGRVVSDHLGRAWLPVDAQLTAARALGMIA